ncbi:hypothetical protein LJC17_01655 [Acholeplasma sp. OttesenSCG-928-E16]|nr:hypothetical protein [Acholeplasma sp. OttesenSCG-928-E16]
MDFLYTAVNSVLSALFLYYILILIFGNSNGKIPFIIYLFITLGRTIFEVVGWLIDGIPIYYPIVMGALMFIPHVFFLILMVRKFGLFNINLRGMKFKHKAKTKESGYVKPIAKQRKLILLTISGVSLLAFTTFLVLKLTNIWGNLEIMYLIISGSIMVASIVVFLILKYKNDKVLLIIGRNEKRVYKKDLLKKEKQEELFIDERYFLDYAGLAYVKDDKKYTTIYHVFILNNDADDFIINGLDLDNSDLATNVANDFEKYKTKSIYYKVEYKGVTKIREE